MPLHFEATLPTSAQSNYQALDYEQSDKLLAFQLPHHDSRNRNGVKILFPWSGHLTIIAQMHTIFQVRSSVQRGDGGRIGEGNAGSHCCFKYKLRPCYNILNFDKSVPAQHVYVVHTFGAICVQINVFVPIVPFFQYLSSF